jgi:hypothetical protein
MASKVGKNPRHRPAKLHQVQSLGNRQVILERPLMSGEAMQSMPKGKDHSFLVGQLRSIGPDGPTYQVLRILDEQRALIRILDAERDVDYGIASIITDPGPDASRKGDRYVAPGQLRRVGGIGQVYRIVQFLSNDTLLIHTETSDEDLHYSSDEAELDCFESEQPRFLAGRFAKLVGQYRTIGPDGPVYQIVGIENETQARIWIVAEDEDELYRLENILLDPIAKD